jgi:hypothetical protein
MRTIPDDCASSRHENIETDITTHLSVICSSMRRLRQSRWVRVAYFRYFVREQVRKLRRQ